MKAVSKFIKKRKHLPETNTLLHYLWLSTVGQLLLTPHINTQVLLDDLFVEFQNSFPIEVISTISPLKLARLIHKTFARTISQIEHRRKDGKTIYTLHYKQYPLTTHPYPHMTRYRTLFVDLCVNSIHDLVLNKAFFVATNAFFYEFEYLTSEKKYKPWWAFVCASRILMRELNNTGYCSDVEIITIKFEALFQLKSGVETTPSKFISLDNWSETFIHTLCKSIALVPENKKKKLVPFSPSICFKNDEPHYSFTPETDLIIKNSYPTEGGF